MAVRTKKKKKKSAVSKKRTIKKTAQKPDKKGITAVVISAFLVLCIIISAIAVHNNSHSVKSRLLDIDKNVAYGIDVSAHNGKIDWEQVSENADFAIIRVGYRGYANGTINADKNAGYNLKHAKKVAMPVGVYFYSQAITPEEAQEEAEFVLDFIKGYRVTLPVFIDYEYAYENGVLGGRLYNANIGRADGGKIVSAFTQTISDAGYTAGIYASSSFYTTKISLKHIDKSTVIWVADYNKKVTYQGDYDIWQYSKKGKCEGVSSKYVDTNYWYLKK